MKAVVPAAGRGTRLRPKTNDRPKGLLEVHGKPILAHCFGSLLALNVSEIVVVVGYLGEKIVDYFGESYRGIPLRYVEQPEPRGLADAIRQAEPHIDEDFVQLNGDNILDLDLRHVLEHHRDTSPAVTLLVERTTREQATETGVLEFDGDRVTGLVEKPDDPPSRIVTTGFSVFSPVVFDVFGQIRPSDRGEYELVDAIDRLLRDGYRVESVRHDGWRMNINRPADIEAAERYLQSKTE